MAENEREIEVEVEVRSLTGEATTVSIPANKSIGDLKLLLKQNFPPASISPNFHLFFKGVKLSLQSHISDYPVNPGEFMVLVPFTRKNYQQLTQHDESATPSEAQNQCSASKLADSAWSDMMQDLSSLRDICRDETQHNTEVRGMNIEDRNEESGRKCVSHSSVTKRNKKANDHGQEGHLDDPLTGILLSSVTGSNIFDVLNCEKFIKVLESVNCLSSPHSGNCMLREANLSNSSLCSCPSWLRTLMKAFCFLNTYSSFLQLQNEKVTLNGLKEVLDQAVKFGLRVGLADFEHLSLLCPKVVHFVNNEKEKTKLRNALVIVRSLMEQRDLSENKSAHVAQINIPIPKVISAMKKREESFKKHLWVSVEHFLFKCEDRMTKFFSLEDLLISVMESGSCVRGNEAKGKKRGHSAAASSHSFGARCCETNPLLPVEMIDHLRMGIGSQGQMVHIEEISARNANYVDIPHEFSESTTSALRYLGVTRLYSHQAEAIQSSLAGNNVVVATMTSSGKSLCYNLPVLETLSQNLLSCALYLFPTKALAQDQLRALLEMTKGFDFGLNIGIYDGDTSQDDRVWLRDNARLLITNPDMLHVSILPFHGQFSRILSNLRFIIIDEAHTYKGAFGCHTALILRRLRRLCAHVYGSEPSFVFCTATAANPREHAMELANLQAMELIQNDGSPSGPKLFVLWNPPLCLESVPKKTKNSLNVNKSTGSNIVLRRSSPILEVSYLFAEIVQHGLRCIAFCKTRKLCELVLCYTREILQETAPQLVHSICAYRAGYIAQDRRKIEGDFFGGNLRGVAATNALELGIDVGHIDVTLHLGFPGSIASLWQQAGRSGRREKPSLAIYVAFEGPIDQYFMKLPQKLFRSPIECCHVDANNKQVLEQHLACAAFEHPLSLLHDEKYFGPGLKNAIMTLKGKGSLSSDLSRHPSTHIWTYVGHEKMPSQIISIRAIETERYKVVDVQKDEILEEIEESRAFFQVYEGAVYMHQGKTYLVKDMDLSSKTALCQKADLKYYTKTRDYTDIHVIGGKIAYPVGRCNVQISRHAAQLHSCKVTTTWFGFLRIWRGSNRVFDMVELSLPSYSYESQAVWIRVPQAVKLSVEMEEYSFRGGLHAACHALLNVVPLYIICNSSDLAAECVNPHDARYAPERILLYDPRPGGTGIAAQVHPLFFELMTAALELLTSCSCSEDVGCPNCVQSLVCHEYNEVLHKNAAIMIIKGVLDAEKSNFGTG